MMVDLANELILVIEHVSIAARTCPHVPTRKIDVLAYHLWRRPLALVD